MSKSLYSPSWYRVVDMKPRLRAHAEIHRQTFRGDVWYLVQISRRVRRPSIRLST